MQSNRAERRAARGLGLDRRRFMRGGIAAGGGLAAAWLAACGGGEKKDEAKGTTAPAAGGSPQAAGAAPQKPTGAITVVQGVDANTLDPSFTNATPESTIRFHIFDTILWRDAKTLKPVPWLAEEFKNIDPLTWEFKLRKGATFHDGSPIDAEAVKFSIDRYANPKIGGKTTVPTFSRQTSYEKTEVVDATTFRIKTTQPSAILTDELTGVPAIPPAYYKDESADNLTRVASKPLGGGPYRFVEWQKDQQIVVEVNPSWWGPTQAFERIIFRPIGEDSTRILRLTNGEADVIVNVPPDNINDVNRSEKARVSSVDGLRKIFVGLRGDKPPLNDKRVRLALNYGLNFDAVNRALLNGSGKRAKSMLNPPHEPPDAKPFEYNINRAKQLLTEAGYPNGFSLDMMAPSGRYIKDKELAQAIAQEWEKIGVKANVQVIAWSQYAGNILSKNGPGPAPLYFLGLGAPVTGQTEMFFVHKDYSLNFTEWQNDEYLKLYDQLTKEMDEKKRQDIMNQAHKILWEEAPWVWVYNQVDHYGVSKKLLWDARPDERIAMFEARWKS